MTNERLLLTDTFETWAKKFNSAMDNIETAIENVPAIETLAPKNHASSANTYGVGNDSLYGHLKISDSVSSTSSVTGGFAASPKAVKTAYDKSVTALNTANNAMTKATTVFTGSTPGLVPEATSSDARKTLLGNGTWGVIEGDAAKMTLSSNLQLTSDSPRSIVLTTTTTGLSVRLPNPSTLPRGAVFHLFVNASEDIQLCDFSGEPIKAHPVLSEYTATRIQLIDATAGLWALANYSNIEMSDAPALRGKLNLGDQIIFSSNRTYYIQMCTLSEDTAIVCYSYLDIYDTSKNSSYAVSLSVIGTDIIVGRSTRILMSNKDSFWECNIVKLSANKALVSFIHNNGYLDVLTLSISGTSTKVEDKITYSPCGNIHLTALSENTALLYYVDSDKKAYFTFLHIDSTGDIRNGVRTNAVLGLDDMASASENTVFIVCSDSSGQTISKLGISENTITTKSSIVLNTPVINKVSLSVISKEKVLIAYTKKNDNFGCVRVVTLSDDPNSSLNDSGSELVCSTTRTTTYSSVTLLSEKIAVVCFSDNNNFLNTVYALRINQNTITIIDEKLFPNNIEGNSSNKNLYIHKLSSNRALMAYIDNVPGVGPTYKIGIVRTITLL